MRIPPFPVRFYPTLLPRRPSLRDLFDSRRTAWKLATRMVGNALFLTTPVFIGLALFAPKLFVAFSVWAGLTILCCVWQYLRVMEISPISGTIMSGGAIYVCVDRHYNVEYTASLEVVEHPSMLRVVQVIVPGLFLHSDVSVALYKPYMRTLIKPTIGSVVAALAVPVNAV